MNKTIFTDAYDFLDNAGMFEPDTEATADDSQLMAIVDSEIEELREALKQNDPVETMDAIIDSIVTLATLGLRCSHGFTEADLEGSWDEVQRSNMTKTIDPTYVDGKLQKGLYFTPPNISRILFG